MKPLLKYAGLLILFLLFFRESRSSHLTGGHITWEKAGKDSFLVTAVLYRDCAGIKPGNLTITARCHKTQNVITAATASPGQPVDFTPVCKTSCNTCKKPGCKVGTGIERYVYPFLIDLSGAPKNCCLVDLSISQCCWNPGYSFMYSPPFFLESTLNRCISDHSPKFTGSPPVILCNNKIQHLNFNAIDRDTARPDSLVYVLDSVLKDHYTSINYAGKYSHRAPLYFNGFPLYYLTFPRGFHIDPNTGVVSFKPVNTGLGTIAVTVKEYRNGKYIGEVTRMIRFTINNCSQNLKPEITTLKGSTYVDSAVCTGNKIIIKVKGTDKDSGDTVTMDLKKLDLPGKVSWKVSNSQHPVGTLTWSPLAAHIRSEPYSFIISLQDDHCPFPGRAFKLYRIGVRSGFGFNWQARLRSCGELQFRAAGDSSVKGDTSLNFLWYHKDSLLFAKGDSITHQADSNGYFHYRVKAQNRYCSREQNDSIYINNFSLLKTTHPHDTNVCEGSSFTLDPGIVHHQGKVNYRWHDGNKDSVFYLNDIRRDTMLYLAYSDSLCSRHDSFSVKVHDRPQLNLGKKQWMCYGDSLVITPVLRQNPNDTAPPPWIFVRGGLKPEFLWKKAGTPGVISRDSFLKITSAGRYKLQIKDTLGCIQKDTLHAGEKSELIANPNAPVICKGDTAILKARITGSSNTIYLWKDLNTGTMYRGREQKLSPDSGKNYQLMITDTLHKLVCFDSSTTSVTVNPVPVVKVDSFIQTCQNDPPFDLDHHARPQGGKWKGVPSNSMDTLHQFYPARVNTGVYTLQYMVEDQQTHCRDSAALKLEVNGLDTFTAGDDTSVCTSGSRIRLVGTPAGGVWSGAGVFMRFGKWYFDPQDTGVNPGKEKLYYQYTHAGKCIYRDSLVINSLQTPSPGFTAIPLSGQVPLKVKFYDQSTGPVNYRLWDFGEGNNAISRKEHPVYRYTLVGRFGVKLIVKDTNSGCGDTLMKPSFISTRSSGKESPGKRLEFKLNPNPAAGEVILQLPSDLKGPVKIYIYNSEGKEVMEKLLGGSLVYYISPDTLKKGTYYLKVVHKPSSKAGWQKVIFR